MPRRSVRRPSLGSAPEERDLHGVHQDPQIQPEGHVLDVEKIVPHLLGDLFEAHRVAVAHLGPAGKPGAHHVAEGVVGISSAISLTFAAISGRGPTRSLSPLKVFTSWGSF